MSRWIIHAFAWGLVALGGGMFYVVLERDPVKGLGLAVGTTLIDIGILFLHEDIKKVREEDNA